MVTDVVANTGDGLKQIEKAKTSDAEVSSTVYKTGENDHYIMCGACKTAYTGRGGCISPPSALSFDGAGSGGVY